MAASTLYHDGVHKLSHQVFICVHLRTSCKHILFPSSSSAPGGTVFPLPSVSSPRYVLLKHRTISRVNPVASPPPLHVLVFYRPA